MRYRTYIGGAAGLSIGYGLSIRKWINNNYGIQIVVLPFAISENYPDNSNYHSYDYGDRDSGNATYVYASLGLVGLKTLADTKYLRFLGYAAANIYATHEDYDYYYEDYQYGTDSNDGYVTVHSKGKKREEDVSVGAGAGVEYYIWRFCLNVMIGAVGGYKIESKGYHLTPSIEGGLFFRF